MLTHLTFLYGETLASALLPRVESLLAAYRPRIPARNAELTAEEIAATLGLSEKTVRNQVSAIFDRLAVEHRAQAVLLALDAGLGRG